MISIIFLLTHNLPYKIEKSDVDESSADSSLRYIGINVKLEMPDNTRDVSLEVKFQGMREENTSFEVPLCDLQGIIVTSNRGMHAIMVIC